MTYIQRQVMLSLAQEITNGRRVGHLRLFRKPDSSVDNGKGQFPELARACAGGACRSGEPSRYDAEPISAAGIAWVFTSTRMLSSDSTSAEANIASGPCGATSVNGDS